MRLYLKDWAPLGLVSNTRRSSHLKRINCTRKIERRHLHIIQISFIRDVLGNIDEKLEGGAINGTIEL